MLNLNIAVIPISLTVQHLQVIELLYIYWFIDKIV